MEEDGKKPLSAFLRDAEVKVVWREDPNLDKPPKVGRGYIKSDDDNFVYLTGEKGTVIVNKKDIIAPDYNVPIIRPENSSRIFRRIFNN